MELKYINCWALLTIGSQTKISQGHLETIPKILED